MRAHLKHLVEVEVEEALVRRLAFVEEGLALVKGAKLL
jgi:hypothetical protein